MTQAFNLSQLANKVNTSGQLDLSTGVYNALAIANGGTNNASLAVSNGGVLYTDGSKVMNTGAGTAGLFLKSTGAGAPVWDTLTIPNGGASVVSSGTNVTLTASSNKIQYISMTTSGLSLNLPAANTLTGGAGGVIFQIYNQGNYTFFIKDNAGNILWNLAGGQSIQLFCYDVSSATGKWATQDAPLLYANTTVTSIGGTLAPSQAPIGTASSGGSSLYNSSIFANMKMFPISSTQACILFWSYAGGAGDAGYLYGVIATLSGGSISFGTAVNMMGTIVTTSTINSWDACLLSSTQGLITWNRITTAYNVSGGFTISGTTITAPTASSTATAVNGCVGSITNLDASYGALYVEGAVRAILSAGSGAPTYGSSTGTGGDTLTGGYLLRLNSTQTLLMYYDTALTLGYYAMRIVTYSGTTAPTLGTAYQNQAMVDGNFNSLSVTPFGCGGYTYSSTEACIIKGTTQYIVNYSSATINSVIVSKIRLPAPYNTSAAQYIKYSQVTMFDANSGLITFYGDAGDDWMICQCKYEPAKGFSVGAVLQTNLSGSPFPVFSAALSSTSMMLAGVDSNTLACQALSII